MDPAGPDQADERSGPGGSRGSHPPVTGPGKQPSPVPGRRAVAGCRSFPCPECNTGPVYRRCSGPRAAASSSAGNAAPIATGVRAGHLGPQGEPGSPATGPGHPKPQHTGPQHPAGSRSCPGAHGHHRSRPSAGPGSGTGSYYSVGPPSGTGPAAVLAWRRAAAAA